jgi:trehalose-6-phosphate synthase
MASVRLMHVSVGANRNMAAYEEIQSEIEQMAGRINGPSGLSNGSRWR